jgi:hypothetical protein
MFVSAYLVTFFGWKQRSRTEKGRSYFELPSRLTLVGFSALRRSNRFLSDPAPAMMALFSLIVYDGAEYERHKRRSK